MLQKMFQGPRVTSKGRENQNELRQEETAQKPHFFSNGSYPQGRRGPLHEEENSETRSATP